MSASSSTLCNVAEDAEHRLVKLLAETAPPHLLGQTFLQDSESCMLKGDCSGLMKVIVNDAGAIQALFLLEPLEEAVSALTLLAALLNRVGPASEAQLAAALADAISSCQGNHQRRITLLSALYNLRSDPRDKVSLLARMVRLAAAHEPYLLAEGQALGNLLLADSATSPVVSSQPRLVSMLDTWKVPLADRRDLYKAIAESTPSRKQRFTLLLVESYQDAKQVDEQGLIAAKDAAIGAIRDPITLFMQQRAMLTMPAIQALASQNDTKRLHGLLTIFQEGKLQDYHAFVESNGGDALYGLESDECISHLRILSLCSLAAEHEEIPYSTIATTLDVEEDSVESWVIAAVSSGLVTAKMDQLSQKVMVERSMVRKFDLQQWKVLQTRLHAWKDNVRSIVEGLKQTQQQVNP